VAAATAVQQKAGRAVAAHTSSNDRQAGRYNTKSLTHLKSSTQLDTDADMQHGLLRQRCTAHTCSCYNMQ
jgi:hypothetical protein